MSEVTDGNEAKNIEYQKKQNKTKKQMSLMIT